MGRKTREKGSNYKTVNYDDLLKELQGKRVDTGTTICKNRNTVTKRGSTNE